MYLIPCSLFPTQIKIKLFLMYEESQTTKRIALKQIPWQYFAFPNCKLMSLPQRSRKLKPPVRTYITKLII